MVEWNYNDLLPICSQFLIGKLMKIFLLFLLLGCRTLRACMINGARHIERGLHEKPNTAEYIRLSGGFHMHIMLY